MNSIKKAQITLDDEIKLIAFATLNEITKETARSILENLSKGVEYDKNAEKYIWESENESLKDFEAGRRIGEKDGESRGKSKGRFQGFMISTLTAITLLGIKIFGERKQKF